MTKPAMPPATAGVDAVEIEIDAMDGMEWEQGQRTPQASDANLAALVRESAKAPEPAAAERAPSTPLEARSGATSSAAPQRARKDAPAMSAPRTPRSPPPREHPRQVTQLGPLGHAGYLAPAVAPGSGRPLTPALTGMARAGSPQVELAASSAGMQPIPAPVERGEASAGMDAFLPTKEYATSSTGSQVLPPAVELAAASGVAPLPTSFDDVTTNRPPRVAAPPASAGSPHSLNDILRAAPRPVRADSPAPVVLPLRAPAETARNPAVLTARDPGPAPFDDPATTAPPGDRLGSAAWRRLLFVMGGIAGGAVLVTGLVVMTGGKSDEHPPSAPVEDHAGSPPATAHGGVAAPVVPPARPALAPARRIAAPEPAAAPESPTRRVSLALAPELTPRSNPAASQPAGGRRPARKLGGKKLVLDYSTRTSEPAMPGLVAQAAEDPAIGLARTAYLSGNQQLFAGDARGAIRAYRESLSLYPGYVGGYRGLGLAYAQLGDNDNALEAFKMYVSTVPGARDVALIKKRIARLQGK